MRVYLSYPLWLTALLLAVPLILIWRHWPAVFPRRQRQAALAMRLALVVAIVVALAGPERSYITPCAQTLVVAADRSASTAEAQYQENEDVTSLASSASPGKDLLGVGSFGQGGPCREPARTPAAVSGVRHLTRRQFHRHRVRPALGRVDGRRGDAPPRRFDNGRP